MTEPDRYTEIPTYFAPGAFAATRVAYTDVYYNVEQLAAASDYLEEAIGRGLPGAPHDITFAYRFAEPGYQRPEPDPNFFRASANAAYIPAGQLALGPEIEPVSTTRARILSDGRPVMQVQLKDGRPPSAAAIAESILYPPPEDMAIRAGAAAWARQIKEAFSFKEAPGRKRRLIETVAARYAGAILLEPRRTDGS